MTNGNNSPTDTRPSKWRFDAPMWKRMYWGGFLIGMSIGMVIGMLIHAVF